MLPHPNSDIEPLMDPLVAAVWSDRLSGTATDGRQAVCLYGPPAIEQPTLEALDRAILALDIAADLDLRSGTSGDASTDL